MQDRAIQACDCDMHELSLARAILEGVGKQCDPARTRVFRVVVAVGSAAGVMVDSLRFAFEILARDTCVEGAELVIVPTPARCRCRRCGEPYEFDGMIGECPGCGSLGGELLSGNEILLREIEVADV
jgi:hydrogenase nickel incorporation protein HypA/HybF